LGGFNFRDDESGQSGVFEEKNDHDVPAKPKRAADAIARDKAVRRKSFRLSNKEAALQLILVSVKIAISLEVKLKSWRTSSMCL
jgi:hypothetical protein